MNEAGIKVREARYSIITCFGDDYTYEHTGHWFVDGWLLERQRCTQQTTFFSLFIRLFNLCAYYSSLFSLIQLILIFDFIGMREMFVQPIMTMICEILRFICASMLSCVHIDDGWC